MIQISVNPNAAHVACVHTYIYVATLNKITYLLLTLKMYLFVNNCKETDNP
jgi:hypothetical protein